MGESNGFSIEGLEIFMLNPLEDNRGSFIKTYQSKWLKEKRLCFDLREQFFSVSKKGVLRGMHFQLPPYSQDKIVTVLHGRVRDVVLDLRKNSKSYGKYDVIELAAGRSMLFIPDGCAHGFLSLEDNTIMLYNVTSEYSREHDTGINYDSFGYLWGDEDFIISEKDRSLPPLHAFQSPFL